MSKPVTDRALAAAWPGRGLPKTSQSRASHGAKTSSATTAGTPTSRIRASRGSRRPVPSRAVNQARPAQARASHSASLRARAARPIRTPRPIRRGSRARAPPGTPSNLVISRHAARTIAAKTPVESGSALNSTRGSSTAAVRPTPIASVRARPDGRPSSAATSPARRQARTGISAPTSTAGSCATANDVPKRAIGRAISSDGSGNQTSNAGRGKMSGGVWKLHRASLVRPWPVTRLRATIT